MKNCYLILVLLWLSSCVSQPFQTPASSPNIKNEAELAALETEFAKKQDNLVLRAHVARQKEVLVNQLCAEADFNRVNGQLDEADALYGRVLKINPASPRGEAGKLDVQAARRHLDWINQAEKLIAANNLIAAEQKLHAVLVEDARNSKARVLVKKISVRKDVDGNLSPSLRTNFNKPVTLEFRDTGLRNIFEIISRTGNINFIFDKEVKADIKATIFVRNIRIEDAIKILLSTNQLQHKMLSENTILIYPNTPSKLKEYQELVVRSFYLGNTDVKQVASLIKTIAKTTDIHVDEKLNLIVIRDTPDVIRLAEKLIDAQDMAEPEVMLEMEVLEVSRNKLQELGIRYPEQIAVSAIGASGTPGSLTVDEWRNLNSGGIRVSVTNPAFVFNLKKIDTDTNLLANPRIRVRNRENAKIHIGERVPVITTTSTANVGISDSVAYLDVGLKLDIVPNVYLDDEVAMKVGLEVSNILETIVTASGTQTYRLGTRNTATTLRLKNGETQVLAGLIQDDERKTANKVPGLSSLPIIGRLFSSNNDSKIKTEIVLLITPRVLRNIVQPEIDVTEFSSGTADSIGKAPINYSPADTRGLPSPVNTNLNQVIPQISSPADANFVLPEQGLQPNLPRRALPVTPISPIPSVPQPMSAPTTEPVVPEVAPVSSLPTNIPVVNMPVTLPAPVVVKSPPNAP